MVIVPSVMLVVYCSKEWSSD